MRSNSTRDEFVESWFKAKESGQSCAELASELGVSVRSLMRRRRRISDAEAIDLPSLGGKTGSGILSEDRVEHYDWTADQCLDHLRQFAEGDPNRFCTRMAYATETGVADSTWNRHFGTFQEFKRSAGIMPSRQVGLLEKKIAKHRSVDHYRDANSRHEWGGTFKRDRASRWKTALIGSDLHDHECDPFWLACFVDTAKRVDPDVIILDGDLFDLPEFGKYSVDPRNWDAVGRIRHGHWILEKLREVAPECEIVLIEGNHEARLLRHFLDRTPALQVLLHELHGWNIRKLLGLDAYEVNYQSRADLAAWNVSTQNRELRKNYRIFWDSFIACHFPDARRKGMPGVNGHHHFQQLWPTFHPHHGSGQWLQLGAGHIRKAEYCETDHWNQGFALAHVDVSTRSTVLEPILVKDHACIAGKYYDRDAVDPALVTPPEAFLRPDLSAN